MSTYYASTSAVRALETIHRMLVNGVFVYTRKSRTRSSSSKKHLLTIPGVRKKVEHFIAQLSRNKSRDIKPSSNLYCTLREIIHKRSTAIFLVYNDTSAQFARLRQLSRNYYPKHEQRIILGDLVTDERYALDGA